VVNSEGQHLHVFSVTARNQGNYSCSGRTADDVKIRARAHLKVLCKFNRKLVELGSLQTLLL